MQETERRAPLRWQQATIERVIPETYRAATFVLSLEECPPFRPGQHMDIRLTAPDGYQAQRSYSLASAPEDRDTVELTVELVDGGEVSPWFHEVATVGDSFEIRGPIGGPFTWTPDLGGPLLLIAGGSGVVPLMSMLRHRQATGAGVKALLLYSARSAEDIIYRDELAKMTTDPTDPSIVFTLTRSRPSVWSGYDRRVDTAMLADVIGQLGDPAWTYLCGPTTFVETVASGLVALDLSPRRIRTERFGPSG